MKSFCAKGTLFLYDDNGDKKEIVELKEPLVSYAESFVDSGLAEHNAYEIIIDSGEVVFRWN